MMSEKQFKCSECDKVFGEKETLEEHSRLEHGEKPVVEKTRIPVPNLGKYLNISFGLGLLIGVLLSSAAFSGYLYWDSLDHRTQVPVTVVTCEECEWNRFQESTDRMFRTSYREVDYQSEEGQKLIEEHNLKYIPGFIFDKEKLEQTGNFTAVEPALVEFEDAYVIPDEGVETAQRLSEGKLLNRSEG